MASTTEEHRAAWDLYRIPRPAQVAFRRRVVEARCEEPEAVAAFAALGISNLMRPAVIVYDPVAAALAALPEAERPAIEAPLFGCPLTILAAPKAEPAPWVLEVWRTAVHAAIDGGHYTPPEGVTVEAIVSSMEFSPIGTLSLIGAHDVETIQGEACERGWVTHLGGAA